ncbi:MAG: type II toxin-antitoxin system HipA family toxin YjjJ [Cardiobacteriaceae bacterium]|nr:type II toxin-antitoxin system HipA family toxin YjjJ [Cardiobacteriaceae bacterium]
MPEHTDIIRQRLNTGIATAAQLMEIAGISQPTLSRALKAMGNDVVRIGAGKSIHYALRDDMRGLPDIAVYRVDREGRLQPLGELIPVRPEGFVMMEADGRSLHSDGLPWWLYDMRPQGYLGRAWARQHAASLGLSAAPHHWADHEVLRALLAAGIDASGNLLLGEHCRQRFLQSEAPVPIAEQEKTSLYPNLALQAAKGELPGSSAGGEQPKFTAYAENGHVLVKFSEAEASPVSERWRDLLLAEHLALQTLYDHGIAAARSTIIDANGQRFLETLRFDRVGERGRLGLHSLEALDLQFVGKAREGWPTLCRELAQHKIIAAQAADDAALLWAFGTLIGNSDMHNGNLSFINEDGRPYALAPVYDMTPMAFAPRSGGGLPDTLPAPVLRADIAPAQWRQAHDWARQWLASIQNEPRLSARFAPCIAALEAHLDTAAAQLARLKI